MLRILFSHYNTKSKKNNFVSSDYSYKHYSENENLLNIASWIFEVHFYEILAMQVTLLSTDRN